MIRPSGDDPTESVDVAALRALAEPALNGFRTDTEQALSDALDTLAAERSLREVTEDERDVWKQRAERRAEAAADLATAEARVRAQIAAVESLHRPITTHDECPHDDPDACDAWETTDGMIVCGPSLGSVCDECRNEDGDRYVEWPCATIRAITEATS